MTHFIQRCSQIQLRRLLAVMTVCVPSLSYGAVNPELLRQDAQASATHVAVIEIATRKDTGQPPGSVVELDARVIEVRRSPAPLEPGHIIRIAFSTVAPADPDFEAGRPGRQPALPPRAPETGERVTAYLLARRMADGTVIYIPAAGEWSFERLSNSEVQQRPAWLNELIDRIANGPVLNPPQAMVIRRCTYRGRTVYLRPGHCCDVPSVLYDESGAVVCHPDGGITGRGDEQCADFSGACEVIWTDPRAESKQ